MEVKLMRSETDRMVAGVCGGLAVYLGVDAVFVRLAFLLLAFAGGIGLPLYLVLAIVLPSESSLQADGTTVGEKQMDEFGNITRDPAGAPQRQHPNGPIIAAVLLILLGVYFLLQNIGFSFLSNGLIWPLLLITAGIYLIARRRK